MTPSGTGLSDLGRGSNQKAYGGHLGLGQDSDPSLLMNSLPVWPRSAHNEFAGLIVDRTCLLPRSRKDKPLSGEKCFVSLCAGSSSNSVSMGVTTARRTRIATRLLEENGNCI
jgi:hypothetical protein